MRWVFAGAIWALAGGLLYRLLGMRPSAAPRLPLPTALPSSCEGVYRPVAQEIIAQSGILGISLNEAFEERAAGHADLAWRLVQLAVSEWTRLSGILNSLVELMTQYAALAQVAAPARTVLASRFKTRAILDFMRVHELFHQLVFRSRLRFQLHLRLLRGAGKVLSAEFFRAYDVADRTADCPPELWDKLDHYFHDLDLIAKETLLTFRTFLVCLPPSQLSRLETDARAVVRRGARSTVNTGT